MTVRFRAREIAAFCLVLFTTSFLFAQSTGGRIIGHVADPTNAPVAGASVTLANQATGVTNNTQSNGDGDFTFLQVPVGTYTVTVQQQGFKQNVRKDVVLELNQVLTLPVTLQVGSKAETVDVTGEAPLVDTTSTQLGAVVDSKSVVGLPLNSRDTYQLLQLQPGVQGVGGSDLFYGSNTAGAVSVNGGRGRSNNFSVNGGDGNDLFVNSPAIQPSPDSIAEFRVLSNTFDAEYGRNSGAVINVVTKSGTNGWHGSAYEFFRNKVLDARGFLDPATPDNKQNQFGATIGGPIKKDRTFIFGSYEGRRVVQGITSDTVVVPTQSERTTGVATAGGVISNDAVAQVLNARCGLGLPLPSTTATGSVPYPAVIPVGCYDPVALNLVNQFVPMPNSSSGPNIFQSIPDERTFAHQFTIRADHRINDRQNFSAYYYFNDVSDAQPFTKFQAPTPNLLPGFGNNNKTRSQQVNLSHTWTLSNNSVNELRFAYFREAQGTFLHPQRTNLVTSSCTGAAAPFCFTGATDTPGVIPTASGPGGIGITPGLGAQHEGVPFISLSGGFTIGNDFEGELPQIGNTYQIADNFTKVAGNHTMKFGVDYRNQRFLQTLFFDPNGDYTYSGGGPNDTGNVLANYFIGLPDSYLQGSTQTEDVRGDAWYLYAQDSWKIKSNLTLNYGLRWEYNQPFYDAGGRYQTFRAGQATTTYPCQLGINDPLNPNLGVSPTSCNPGSGNEAVFPLGLVVPGDKGVQKGLTASYYHAFAPRIGMAWDPWKDGKTTIRAGFGIFYNPIEQLVLEQFQGEPPFGGSSLISEGFFQTPFVFQSCTAPCSAANGGTAPNPFGGILNPPHGANIDWASFRPLLLFGELQPNLRAQYTNQYNLGIQHQFAGDLVFSLGYVGSQGHRLLVTHDLNFGNAQTCLDLNATLGAGSCGPFFADSSFTIPAGTTIAPQGLHLPYNAGSGGTFIPGGTVVGPNGITLVGLRPFSSPFCQPFTGVGCPSDGVPVFSSIFAQDTIANSAYNSLQASLEKRLAHGLQFEIAYTYSKSLDAASSFENILKPICPGASGNLGCNRALSLYDARHRVVISYLWELPIPKYQGAAGKAFNGWNVSGITTFQSGFPIRLESSNDSELENSFDFELPGKPNLLGPFQTGDPRSNSFCAQGTGPAFGSACQTGNYFFNPNIFGLPDPTAPGATPASLLGNAPRTICCGPGIDNFDFSIQKITPLTERQNLEFRAEFFNAFNHTQFLNPDGNISDGADFGRVKHTRPPRSIQFALKYSF